MSAIGHNRYADLPERRREAAVEASGLLAQRAYLEDMRKPTLENLRQEIIDLGKVNKTDAERQARRSPQYATYCEGLREARIAVGKAYAEVAYLDQLFKEWQGRNATARAEMGMNR